MTAGDNKQQKHVTDGEGGDEEGGKGNGNSDEGGGQAMATMVKMRVRAARAMVTRVVGDEVGGGNGGNMARNNDDGLLAPIIVQQAVLYSASASLNDVGDNESTGRRLAHALLTDNVGDDQTTTTMMVTLFCRPLMLQRPLVLLSLASPWGRNS